MDIVDINRQSFEQETTNHGQPLLNAVRNQQVFENFIEESTALEAFEAEAIP